MLKALFAAILMAAMAMPAAAADGKALYDGKCASCHGKDGKGNAAMAKVFKVDAGALDLTDQGTLAKSEADLIKVTSDGMNKMPAFKAKLKEAEITAVVAYVRGLGPKK